VKTKKFGSDVMLGAAAAASMTVGALAGDAVQWRVEDGGNGHWYQLRSMTTNVSWHDASRQAVAAGGHLATLNSREEYEWLRQTCFPTYAGSKLLLGGIQRDSRSAVWEWITGEPFTTEPWMGDFSNDGANGKAHVLSLDQKGLDLFIVIGHF
jgi:hypothetical protein